MMSMMFGLISQQRWFQLAFPDSLWYFVMTLGLWLDFSVKLSRETLRKEETLRRLHAFGAPSEYKFILMSISRWVGPPCRGTLPPRTFLPAQGWCSPIHIYQLPSHSLKTCISVLAIAILPLIDWHRAPTSLQGQPLVSAGQHPPEAMLEHLESCKKNWTVQGLESEEIVNSELCP